MENRYKLPSRVQRKYLLEVEKESGLSDWKTSKLEASRKGALARSKIYGELGTPEGRRLGGINSMKRRELMGNLSKPVKEPKDSEDLAELMGILLGDGCLSRYQFVIYLNSETDVEYAYYVKDLIYRLFDLMPSISQDKDEKVLRIMLSRVNLVKYLERKGLKLGNKVLLQVVVPLWIWSKPEYVKACIRGLIDTDGCFAIHRYSVNGQKYSYPKINFTNRSLPLLKFVHDGLISLGYNPKNGEKYKVWLYNKSDVKKYLEDIGTRNFKASFFLKDHSFWEGGPDGKEQVC
ncbi:hypothetical protein HYZ70_03100 [Candidatus Curtissbacteria bacterium]|nr:hypothetical protein [Candidatus Curtissbacteria bacterium]